MTSDYVRRALSPTLLDGEKFTREELINIVELSAVIAEDLAQPPRSPEELYEYRWKTYETQNYQRGVFRRVFPSQVYRTALSYRGVRQRGDGLDARQRATIIAVTSVTGSLRGINLYQKLAKLDVTEAEYRAWLNYPPFREKLERLSQKALKNAESLSDVALANGAVAGKLDHIKYLDQRQGRTALREQQDMVAVMRSVLEVVMRHVSDPVALRNIAADMQRLAATASIDLPGGMVNGDNVYEQIGSGET